VLAYCCTCLRASLFPLSLQLPSSYLYYFALDPHSKCQKKHEEEGTHRIDVPVYSESALEVLREPPDWRFSEKQCAWAKNREIIECALATTSLKIMNTPIKENAEDAKKECPRARARPADACAEPYHCAAWHCRQTAGCSFRCGRAGHPRPLSTGVVGRRWHEQT